MTFDEWLRQQDHDKPIDPRMAWEAADHQAGLLVLRTMLQVFDIIGDPTRFREVLVKSIVKEEIKQ